MEKNEWIKRAIIQPYLSHSINETVVPDNYLKVWLWNGANLQTFPKDVATTLHNNQHASPFSNTKCAFVLRCTAQALTIDDRLWQGRSQNITTGNQALLRAFNSIDAL